MSKFKIDHDESLCIELYSVMGGDGKIMYRDQIYKITLLKGYGHGPMGPYDVIYVYDSSIGHHNFMPAHMCKEWSVGEA